MSKPIQPDIPDGSVRYFTNCRGVNLNIPLNSEWKKNGYVSKIRPEVWLENPLTSAVMTYAPSDSFVGTNKTAQWWYYNSEDAENAISILRSNGLNAVRVFLDYYVWVHKGDDHLADIKNFLSICDNYKVRVQFVLWDQLDIMAGVGEPSTAQEASSITSGALPYNLAGPGLGVAVWGNVPLLFETSSAEATTSFLENKAKPYVDALASSVSSYQSMWSFDVQNESEQDHLRILTSGTSLYLNANYPFVKTTFGNGAGYDPGLYYLYQDTGGSQGSVGPWYQLSSTVDFASLHTYGNSAYHVKRYIREGVSGAADTKLPSMYSEASNYPTLNYPREVIQFLHKDKNFGGLIYQAFTERNGTRNPFNYTQGIFFSDGECRRSLDISAYQGLAVDQWDFSRRQLNPNITQKGVSPDGSDDGGYTSGVNTGVIGGYEQVGVLPEHVSYQPSYSGLNEVQWNLARNAFYGAVPVIGEAAAIIMNPGFFNLNAYRYSDVKGSIHSQILNKDNTQPSYSLNASDITIKDTYDAFFTLSSLPKLATGFPDNSQGYDARNNQILYMSHIIYMLTRTLFAASGQFSTPNILRESLYGTAYDDLSGVHQVLSVEDRLAFSSAASALRDPGSKNSMMPAANGRDITGLTGDDASSFICHLTSSCIYTTASPPSNPTMNQINWSEYDYFYENLITKAAVCISKLQKYGTDVDPDFSIF